MATANPRDPQTQQFEQLTDELYENQDNPRALRGIVGRLNRLGDPRAIPELAALYNKLDGDPGVRRAAAAGLRKFRHMEQRVALGQQATSPLARLSPDLLERARIVLGVLLLLTALGNGALIVVKSLPPPAKPAQSVATPRDVLTAALKSRIDDTRKDATSLRARWQEIQSKVKPTCPGTFTTVEKLDMQPVDLRTYPDLQNLNDNLNAATQQIVIVRNNWNGVCSAPADQANIAHYAGTDGAAGQIKTIDNALKALSVAESDYNKWVNQPVATVAPTYTPITPTDVPPTITLTPTPGPTLTSTLTLTATVPTATLLPAAAFSGAKLETLDAYQFKLSVKYNGQQTAGGPYDGSLTVQYTRQNKPLAALVNVSLSGDEAVFKAFSKGNPFLVKGQSFYVALNGTAYTDSIIPPGTCKVAPVGGAGAPPFDTLKPEPFLSAFTDPLPRAAGPDTTVNGFTASHFSTTVTPADPKKAGYDKAVIDLFVTVLPDGKMLPVRLIINLSGSANLVAGITNAKVTQLTTQYDLLTIRPDVSAIKPPLGCPAK